MAHRSPALDELRIVQLLLEPGQSGEIAGPLRPHRLVDEGRQVRVGAAQPAARADPVGLGVEPVGEDLVEVPKLPLLEELGVELRDAVDGVGSDDGDVGHPDPALARLLDQRHPAQPIPIPHVGQRDVAEKAMVDLVDQLEVAGQQGAEHVDRPLLEGLRQQGVVGVCAGPDRQIPRFVPSQLVLVHQEPHQLQDRQGRVGVVHLDRRLVGKRLEVQVVHPVAPEDVLDGAGDEEVLLLQPQHPTRHHVLAGIEDLRDVLRRVLLRHRLDVVAGLKVPEVELVAGPRRP